MEVKINRQNLQFEIRKTDDHLAYMGYRIQDGSIYIMHTEVPKPLREEGLAKELAEFAIQYAKDEGLQLVAYCPFMRSYLKRRRKD